MALRSIWLRIPFYLVGVYFILCGSLYFFQESLLFPRGAGDFVHCPEMEKSGAGARQMGDLRFYEKTNPKNKTTFLVFHGNGDSACKSVWLIKGLQDLPLNFVIAEYPGYGQLDPNQPPPSEATILDQAARVATLFAKSGTHIIIYGESLGSGVATYVAQKIPVSALIVQAPYTSIIDVAQTYYPIFPIRLLSRASFRAGDWAARVTAPVLVLRAGKDKKIPPAITDLQIKNFASAVEVVNFPDARHGTMESGSPEVYWKSLRTFIQKFL